MHHLKFLLSLGTLFLGSMLICSFSYAVPTKNKTHQWLLKIYQEHPYTFFCEQPFHHNGEVNLKNCHKCPPLPHKIRWMPVVSRQQLAKHLRCYSEKICVHKYERTKGLSCCQKQDKTFQLMERDLHNLVPEIAPLAQLRARANFGTMVKKSTEIASCQLQIDKTGNIIDPPEHTKGPIARTYLYMRNKYGITLTPEEYQLYLQWHRAYPVSDWERRKNNMIKELQGNDNLYVR